MTKREFCYFVIGILVAILPSASFAKKIVYENGDVYDGKIKNKVPNGEGTMKYADGKIYTGYWVDGVPNGKGSLVSSVLEYSGLFYNGEYYGRGEMILKHDQMKIVLSGFWKNNNNVESTVAQIELQGNNVAYYEGSMITKTDNLPIPETGEGSWIQFIHNDSNHIGFYKGKWVNGRFTGTIFETSFAEQEADAELEIDNGKIKKAIIKYPDGTVYEGESDYYNITGLGLLKTGKGKEIRGRWDKNKLIDAKFIKSITLNDGNVSKVYFEINPQYIILRDQFGVVGQIKNNTSPIYIDEIFDSFIISKTNEIKERRELGELQKKREEEELRREEEVRRIEEEKRLKEVQKKEAEFINNFNSNYAGLIFQASGASFSDSADDALGNALFGFKTDAVMMFLPDGKVTLQTIRNSTRNGSYESMVAASLNMEDNQIYHIVYDGQPGTFYVSELGSKIIVSKDRNLVKYEFPSGRVLSLKGLKNVGPITNTVVPKSMPLGTYKGDLILNVGFEATGFYSLTLMPGNKYKVNMQMKVHNPLFKLVGDTYDDTKEGTYRIENGKLITFNKEGKITEKFTIILGGNGLLCYSPNIKCILTRRK